MCSLLLPGSRLRFPTIEAESASRRLHQEQILAAGRISPTSCIEASLQASKIPGPYILVGHSLGGSVVQVFAHTYPNEVAGLVLVDPEDSRLVELLKAQLPPDVWAAREKILSPEKLPTPIKREFDGMMSGKEHANTLLPFPPVPVVLLTGTQKNPDFPGNPIEQDLKLDLHNQLAARVPRIEHVLVPESRHYIQDDAPPQVTQAIEHVLAKARAKTGAASPQN